MNKKVGIVTLHRTTNYGSVLQAYALQETIKELGYDSEIIDYRPSRSSMLNMIIGLKNKNKLLRRSIIVRTIVRLIMIPSYILRFKTFKRFVKHYLNLSQNYYKEENDLLNNPPFYNVYCTGSDQVWNSEWNGKIDKPLFLNFASNDSLKIAYAASFGKEKLDSWEKKETKELLSRYNYITVRELSGLKILNELGIRGGECVLDPSLLFDKYKWSKISSKKIKNDNYILVYNLNRNKRIHEYAIELSKKTGFNIKYITYQLHDFYKKGKMYCNTSVENYLSLIENAQYVVTDSFHGVAFSINFNKNFMVIYPKKFSSRLDSLLKITKLSNRIVTDTNMESLLNDIDYKEVNTIINNERKKSIDILKRMLEGGKYE